MRAMTADGQELLRRRAISRQMDVEEQRARERANAVAPPLALLTAAFVLSAILGFAAALVGELKRPRVSNSAELERFLGIRVLATVETPMPSVDRGRREADRQAPPYFDPGAEGYQLTYLGLATDHPMLLAATVTGDDPSITAVVASNLAAVAADEARNTIVMDLDPTRRTSAALRGRTAPGVADIVERRASWPDATVSMPVGRDKRVDLVPFGGGHASGDAVMALLRQDAERWSRYYDAVFVVAPPDLASAGIASALPSADVIYCAQPGITPLRPLKTQLEAIRAAGGAVRGIVLWNAERPLLPATREREQKGARAPAREAVGAV